MTSFTAATITPMFEHDCDACKFCGNFVDIKNDGYAYEVFDLYYCPADKCLIARYEKDGNYISADFERGESYPKDHPIGYLYHLLKARKVIKMDRQIAEINSAMVKAFDEAEEFHANK